MMDISFGKLQGKLMASEQYNIVDAAIMTEIVMDKFDGSVRESILKWADGADVTDAEHGGMTVKEITEEIGCTAFQALCIINAVMEDPECYAAAVFRLSKDRAGKFEDIRKDETK
jgi:hypothetical protein